MPRSSARLSLTTADQQAATVIAEALGMKPLTLIFLMLKAELDLIEALEARCDAVGAGDGVREQVRAFVSEHVKPIEARSRVTGEGE